MSSESNSESPPVLDPHQDNVALQPLFPRVAELGNADEDWTGITEQAKRRKLQNRLNQRARRQRLLASKTQQQQQQQQQQQRKPLLTLVTTSKSQGDDRSKRVPVVCRTGLAAGRAQLEEFARQAFQSYHLGTLNILHLSDTVRVNVFHALVRNVALLGFDGGWLTYDAISPFASHGPLADDSPVCPDTLRPTSLQIRVPHHPWIDLLPCPRMRDNFLTAVLLLGEDNVDEDALCKDVVDSGGEESPFAGPDALIAWTDPWSPGGWEVTEPFLRKWGWIVRGCVELQEGTNTWRSRRGLPSLRFPGC